MSVHYKFKSAISYDTITFDGLHISVKDLKKAILHQKQIGKNTDFDLQVINAQTNEEYTNDQTLIPKNTSLIVSRIPLTTQQKKAWERAEQNNQLVLSKQILNLDSHEPDSIKLKGADLLGSNASEEEKINAMMAQSTQEYDPSNFVKIRGGNQYGEVPPNYVCHRCHNPGHWIKNCPNNNTTSDPVDIKKATGIPRGFLVPVDGPSVPGAMLTGLGTFAVPSIDQEAYKQSMKPQKKQETQLEKVIIPEDLLCNLCSDLLTDAIMMPCCGTSFCDECIRNALLESEENECPDCHGKEISPETLIPNRYLRNAVNGFKDKTGYSKRIEAAKVKVSPIKDQPIIPEINIDPPPKEEMIISVSAQSLPSDSSTQVSKVDIYQKIAAVGDPIDKNQRNYSAIGTINNNNNNTTSHNHSTFKPQGQSQVQSQAPPVSVSNNSRPNNTNVHIPGNNSYQNTRHTSKSTESRVSHISRYNSQSLSIPPHPHLRTCLPLGPADISIPPPPFAHPPPSIQPDVAYNQMQPIHNPPPPGLDRNSSPANASSDEGMHPPESTHHHQMDKFENQTGTLQSMIRGGYATGYYPPPMSNYDHYNMPMDMRSRGFHRGYSRRPTRGQQIESSYRPDFRNGGNYINNKRTIDDPLAVFQRILRERDNKRRDMRNRHSISRSRSRSLSRSRSRERSRSISRSPSRIMKHRTRSISRSITPRRRSRTRSRSPVRKRKKSLSPVKRLPMKTRRRTRSPSRDISGRRSRSLSLHRRTRSRSRSPIHRNRISPSLRFRSRSPTFYSSPARFSNYHREDDNFGPKGGNWRGRGTWNKGTQPYHQSHRYRGQFEGHYDVGIDRPTEYAANYAQFDPHYAMDPNLVRDWDEIRDKEIREREKEKKLEEDKLKKKSKSHSPFKHHKVEKLRQEHKPSPEKNHKDSDKKDKGKRKKKKDTDVDKKKKKKSRDKKEKDDTKKSDEKEEESNEGEIKLEVQEINQDNQEPAAPGTSESPPPFESVAIKETVQIKDNITDELYGGLDEGAPVDTSWGSYKSPEISEPQTKSIAVEPVEEKPKEPEVLAELPERSKWEVEDDVGTSDDKFDASKSKEDRIPDNSEFHYDSQVSVTNEVLKRAENAIFQKTIRSLDVSGKKTVSDKFDSIKDKKPDVVKDKKIETEKYLGKDKKPDIVKEKKFDVSKEKKLENGKEKKIEGSRDKKIEIIKDKKQEVFKEKKPDISKDFKDKKLDVDKDKKNDVKDKKLDNLKDKKFERERRFNDKSETKTSIEKSSRKDDYTSRNKDKKHLESDASLDSLSIQREARKSGNSIQITIPTDSLDDKKSKEGIKRISAKERLGEKVEDKDDKHYKPRNEKRKASRSPVRVHSTLIVPEPLPRKIRATSKTRRDSLKKDRNSKNERISNSVHRPSRRDDDKISDNQRKKSETGRVTKMDDKHGRVTEQKSVVSKKDVRQDKKEEKKKEEKREEVIVKKPKPKEKEPEKKERKNRRLEPDRKIYDDEIALEHHEDDDDDKKLSKESDDSASSSSSSSSSSDSSPVRSKKKKKTKKRKKKHVKKKKLASSSDSDDSDSSSESDEANNNRHKKKKKKEQRKHKVHKKSIKKKKKSKHK
ncbi:E3 ubiquitin-protein ligase RBBP6 isoform X2 [Sipha flava]|uniref:E3 ubiquitin-protein ligase RBBP6 isoform X2 n=1 Tax=Sipha flava TaxID=143950 RepID=A0A8B8G2W3_9HEMI|nr:E3 ubiquitin-protein ligase RBBP6 isoform X2 [Sipha flava]